MTVLLFYLDVEHVTKSDKNTKCPYINYMMSDQKNKGTLFSSTFEVEEMKEPLFFGSEVNLVSYWNFIFLLIWPK